MPSEWIAHTLVSIEAALIATSMWVYIPGTGAWPLIVFGSLFCIAMVLAGWYWSPAQRHRRAAEDQRQVAELLALVRALDRDDSPDGPRP